MDDEVRERSNSHLLIGTLRNFDEICTLRTPEAAVIGATVKESPLRRVWVGREREKVPSRCSMEMASASPHC
ncbi:hypothetical protein [Paraburkholderia steynii]|uniref:hypothetical protein n=1 Tax=Paraburkholderia steynii TaxID=1245441 RepID=UPI00115FD23C|nr:hypothetical protein [Paraburkholderia steynii]